MNKGMKNNKKEKKLKNTTIIYTAIIIAAAYLILIAVLIYGFGVNNRLTKFTSKYIPYPAAIVNYKSFITVNDLDNNLQSIKRFYENQDFSQIGMRVDFSTDEGKKRLKIREKQLLNKMIEDKAIEILSQKNGVRITADLVDQNVQRKLDEYGTEEATRENLSRLYGWTMDDFKKKVVRPGLYSEELEKLIISQNKKEFSGAAREKIEKAKKELDGKKDFSEVAKLYSEGSTARDGGELGWFKKDQLISEVSVVAFSLNKGQRSDIIESALGYHIIEVEDKKTEGNEEMVKVKQIFTRKKSFADWLGEQIKNMKIFVPVKGYYWNQDQGLVEFSDQNLREFESNIMENFQGDASVIF